MNIATNITEDNFTELLTNVSGITGDGDADMKYQCDLLNFAVRIGVLIPMIVFGFVGNTLSQVVMWPEINTSATSFSLFMLAVVDNAYLVSRVLLKCMAELSGFLGWWPEYKQYHMKGIIKEIAFFLAQSTTMMTTWVTVIVTFQRYIAVCLPHRVNQLASLKVTRIQVTSAILISALFTLVMVVFENNWEPDKKTGILLVKKKDWANSGSAYNLWYRTVIYWIIGYAIPLILLVFLTTNLIRSLSNAQKRKENLTHKAKDKNGVTKTLVAVVTIFVLCQVVTPIRRIWAIFSENRGCGTRYPKFNLVADVAGTFNSSVNFILYCVFGLRFRRKLMGLLPCFPKRVVPDATNTASVTNPPQAPTFSTHGPK